MFIFIALYHIDKSKEIELDGLWSLKYLNLRINSLERFSARNLPSLKHLVLYIENLSNKMSKEIFENLSNLSSIKELQIIGNFSGISFKNLVNLEKLSITCNFSKNFSLFKNLRSKHLHLQELSINIKNLNDKNIIKLFSGNKFPYLVKLNIEHCKMTKLEKKMFEGFPMLRSLSITQSKPLRLIDADAFSSLTNLVHLNLSWNSIKTINQRTFSGLINLETLILSCNSIDFIEKKSFSSLKNLIELNLCFNRLSILNPKVFIGLRNLKKLNLKNNMLTDFDLSKLEYYCNIDRNNLVYSLIVKLKNVLRRSKDSKIGLELERVKDDAFIKDETIDMSFRC